MRMKMAFCARSKEWTPGFLRASASSFRSWCVRLTSWSDVGWRYFSLISATLELISCVNDPSWFFCTVVGRTQEISVCRVNVGIAYAHAVSVLYGVPSFLKRSTSSQNMRFSTQCLFSR